MGHCRQTETHFMQALIEQDLGNVTSIQKSCSHFTAATQAHVSGSSQGILFQDQQYTDAAMALVTLTVFQLPAIYHADTDKS